MNDEPMTHELALDLAPAYVLGALEPAEEAAVRDHLSSCRLSHDEFAQLGGVVPYLAELPDLELVEPPPALRDRIMAAAAADLAERTAQATAAPAAPVAPAGASVPGPAIPFPSAADRAERTTRRTTTRLGWAARIAAVIAIVVLGGWNVLLQGQLSDAGAYDRAVAAVIDAAGTPGSQTVVLSPQPGATAKGIAAVAPDGSVVMAMRDLPATAGTQVYEAWVIVGKAAPVAVGGFTVGGTGVAAVTTRAVATPPGSTIALTLEPSAGSTAPRGQIVAAGVSLAPPQS
jgi:hypothetical protein